MKTNEWKMLIIPNLSTYNSKRIFVFREHLFSEDKIMGANVANLYRVFQIIDSEYKLGDNPYCCKGCNLCCSDYFNISFAEFCVILQHLKIVSPLEINRYCENAKRIAEMFDVAQNDIANIDGFPPCIFLDSSDGGCKIYEVRPTMCRLYGNVSGITKCPKLLNDKEIARMLIPLKDNSIFENIEFFKSKGSIIQPLERSIVYWFSRLDETGNFTNNRLRDLFQAATDRPISGFVQILQR